MFDTFLPTLYFPVSSWDILPLAASSCDSIYEDSLWYRLSPRPQTSLYLLTQSDNFC